MKLLGAASTAASMNSAAGSMQGMASSGSAQGAAQNANIQARITVGGSESKSTTTVTTDTAHKSLVSGKNVVVMATGDGANSTIDLRGSDIKASEHAKVWADGEITLSAAQNTTEQQTRDKSIYGGAGIGISYGKDGWAAGFTANANGALGKADGRTTEQVNSHITGNLVSIHSGGPLTLDGAVISGNRVEGDVKGPLVITSRQDTATFDSQQASAGGSVTIGYGFSGSGSASASMAKGDFASVKEQSGIKAGDGGFALHVDGKTTLNGAVITSTQAAMDAGKNSFTSTGGVATADIQNHDKYSATGVSLAGSTGKETANSDGMRNFAGGSNGMAAGIGNTKGSQSSTTTAGISGIAGDQSVRTDSASKSLTQNWNGADLTKEVNAQLQITSTFGQQASKAIGDYATAKYNELKDSNPQEAAKWAEGGEYRVAAHTVVGGLTGGLGGAVGAAASQLAIDAIGKQIAAIDLPSGVKSAVVVAAGAAVGAVAGGVAGGAAGGATTGATSGASAALNATTNNYLNHTQFTQKSAELNQCTTDACRTAVTAKWSGVSQSQNAAAVDSCLTGGAAQCSQNVDRITEDIAGLTAEGRNLSKGYTGYTPEERNNLKQAMAQVATNLELLAAKGNEQLATTSSTPDELAAAGYLTSKEANLLKSIRADNMVGFLGAVALPSRIRSPSPSVAKPNELLAELTSNGVKFSAEAIIRVSKMPDGRVIFLEKGNLDSGFNHILNEHKVDFANVGISESRIPQVLFDAIQGGKIVGYQGRGTARPIYELDVDGVTQRFAITIGSNGYIVGANPKGGGK